MGGKTLNSIITDPDGAMQNAITTVFPRTHLKFYLLHISNNVMIHLKYLKSNHSKFEKEYND